MDIKKIKDQIRLIDLFGGMNLKKVAMTGGGELAGPCPFCGGTDRFRVQPSNNIWLCRNCTAGKWRDVVDFVAMRDNITLGEAARQLTGDNFCLPASPGKQVNSGKPTYNPYMPPGEPWQSEARQAVDECEATLYSETGARALDYLYKRGFTKDTLQRFKIGFSSGYQVGNLYIPAGITIPCFVNNVLWYIKIRTNSTPKYTLVKGSKPKALFNGDEVASTRCCFLVEGEFNAMIGAQDLGDLIAVGSFGSAGNRPPLDVWGKYFFDKLIILTLYDHDTAGENGAVTLRDDLGDRVTACRLPENTKDLNDYFLADGDLFNWLMVYIREWELKKQNENTAFGGDNGLP